MQGEFINKIFSNIENQAILATTKINDINVMDENELVATNLYNEKLFLLSKS